MVGLGASAGGLEAFEAFLSQLRPGSGMAYVLVQHLDPTHISQLASLLQRRCALPVLEVAHRMRVQADTVYVLTPRHQLSLSRGELRLSAPPPGPGPRLPIDAFFRSLAGELGPQAVGIVMSGTGSDGSKGLRALLAAGGQGLVQEPSSARFAAMPQNALRQAPGALCLAASEMPAWLQAVRGSLVQPARVGAVWVAGVERVIAQLRQLRGHDFSSYKKSTVGRRIERRMAQHRLESPDAYAELLEQQPKEAQHLMDELLINVTAFFRDPEAFELLRTEVLPMLLDAKAPGEALRIWVAAGSSGEEAYSLAMLLSELLEARGQQLPLQIYSTDLDADAIATARAGRYPLSIEAEVSPVRLQRFFTQVDGGYRVKKALRDQVVFAVHNVLADPPFTRLDLLCCRNLMIYLEAQLQNRLLPVLHYALRPGGVLFLSPSESVGLHTELFVALNRRWKMYRCVALASAARFRGAQDLVREPTVETNQIPGRGMVTQKLTDFGELARRYLLQDFAPASVVTDAGGQILYVHGDTAAHLRPAPGQPSLNVADMAQPGLQTALRTAIQQAAQGRPVAPLDASKGSPSFRVRTLAQPGDEPPLLLISFFNTPPNAPKDATPSTGRKRAAAAAGGDRLALLEQDLAHTRGSLQASLELEQTANEELKSANEELQATNEELQSSNEELETSREELQSVNEELVTVNAELQLRVEQLADMQNDMKNLLDNINVGTVFLDNHLIIRRFTKEASRAYRLVPSDIGRSLGDIKCDLLETDLLAEARSVIDTLVAVELEVRNEAGATYLARMQPYRTMDNVIAGVVLTFADISRRALSDGAMAHARELAEGIVNTVREPLVVLDAGLRVVSISPTFCSVFGLQASKAMGQRLYELGEGEWQLPRLRELLETVLPSGEACNDWVVERPTKDGKTQRLLMHARRLVTVGELPPLILLAIELPSTA